MIEEPGTPPSSLPSSRPPTLEFPEMVTELEHLQVHYPRRDIKLGKQKVQYADFWETFCECTFDQFARLCRAWMQSDHHHFPSPGELRHAYKPTEPAHRNYDQHRWDYLDREKSGPILGDIPFPTSEQLEAMRKREGQGTERSRIPPPAPKLTEDEFRDIRLKALRETLKREGLEWKD